MLTFLAAIAVAFLSGSLIAVSGNFSCGSIDGCGMHWIWDMLLWDVVLLYEYFPQSDISAFLVLRWADEFLPLAFTGLCINIGLFAHL